MTVRITQEGVVLTKYLLPINSKKIASEIETSRKVRDKTKRWVTRCRPAMHIVIMNLISCTRKSQRLFYSRQKNKRVDDMYNPRNLNNYDLMLAVDELESYGMLRNYIADRQYGDDDMDKMCSWITATPEFMAAFCTVEAEHDAEAAYMAANINIELRDKDKKRIPYVVDEHTIEADRVVRDLNTMNARHSFKNKDGDEISNIYTRIFNNSLLEGGRWFKAGILNMSNKGTKDRLRITIDDNSICEVDFDCLHISLLADELGVGEKYDTDVYYMILEKHQYSVANRTLCKMGVNMCLNAKSLLSAYGAIDKFISKYPKGTFCFANGKDLVYAIKHKLPDFSKLFCNKQSTGLRLQNKDSWIAHHVLDLFTKADVPILVIHDSFIVEHKHADMLVDAMSQMYKKVVGVDRVVRMKMNWIEDGLIHSADCSK